MTVVLSGATHRGGHVVVSNLGGLLRCSARVQTLRVDLDAAAGETAASLRARADQQLAEQALIAETLEQDWPRLDGETPDQAHHWQAAGFADAEVLAWLEAGVPWAAPAQQLRDAGVAPRQVGGQFELDVTLGLAFARGEVSLEQVFEEARS